MKYLKYYKIFENYRSEESELEHLYKLSLYTEDLYLIDIMLKKGIDINSVDSLNIALSYKNEEMFKFLLSKGAIIKNLSYRSEDALKDLNFQKILIDFGIEDILYDNKIPLNNRLKDEKEEKYRDVYNMSINKKKFGL